MTLHPDCELWDPRTGTWTELAPSSRDRVYHNTAMLLPDGRVLVGGRGRERADGGFAIRHIRHISTSLAAELTRADVDDGRAEARRLDDAGRRIAHQGVGVPQRRHVERAEPGHGAVPVGVEGVVLCEAGDFAGLLDVVPLLLGAKG